MNTGNVTGKNARLLHNKRLMNGYHRMGNGLVPAKTEVQRMRNGQNVLSR